MNNPLEEWPPYHIGTSEHLHAIGVLIATWNEVENCYQAFIQQIFPLNVKSAVRTFQILNNDQRVRLIRDELITVLPGKEAGCVEHFLNMANICYQNRNVFSHATSHSAAENDKLRISKGTGKDNIGDQYLFSLDYLKEMADSTHETFTFGINVWGTIQPGKLEIATWLGVCHHRLSCMFDHCQKNLLCHEVGIKSAKFPHRLRPRLDHFRRKFDFFCGRASSLSPR
jgi:hypothetical protein